MKHILRRFLPVSISFFPLILCLTLASEPASAGLNQWASNGLQGVSIAALAIDPSTPATLYAGSYGSGIFKSPNGGADWSPASTGLPDFLVIIALAIDPATPATLYAGTLGSGVFKSANGGADWSAVNNGLPEGSAVSALTIDPSTPATLYASIAGSGVFKSANGGADWNPASSGLPDFSTIRTLAIDPSTPATLYAGTWDSGVFKSANGGADWNAVNNGLPEGSGVPVLAIDPSTPATLYAGTLGSGVFKSANGGADWSAVNNGLPEGSAVSALAIDPSAPATLYAGTLGSGVFKSANGGANWIPVNNGQSPTDITAFAIAPSTPVTLYAGTSSDGIFVWTSGDVFTIATTAGPNGSISCIPNPVNTGESSTCTVTPTAGYTVDTFTVDGTPATLTNNQSVFSNATADHTANVTFTLKPVVTVAATDASAKEAGATTGIYRVTRTGSTTVPISVYYVMSGKAASGADYTMSSYTSATIAAGATYADVVLTALDDTLREPGERATLTLLPNSAYEIGSPGSADIDIDNNNATSVDTPNAMTSLDQTFGTSGRVQLNLGAGANSGASALVLLPDDKLLVAGWSTQPGQNQTGIIVRLNSDGSIDTTFGSGGTGTATFGTFSKISGLVRQDDGKLVAIGTGGASMNVMRLIAAGTLDTSFAGDGTAEISDARATAPSAVAVYPDGRIVVAANRLGFDSNGLTVFRLLVNGTLDTNFGTNGFASAPVTGTDMAQSITLQADGKIVVVGTTNANANPFLNPNLRDFAIARFNSDGTLDTTFDSDGMKVIDIAGRDDDPLAVLMQPADNKIVIAGSAYMTASRPDCAMVRLNSDGSLDAGFDGDGKAMFYMGGLSVCNSLTRQSDGTFIGSGIFAEAIDREFMVTRILANGQQDTTFNEGAGFAVAVFPPINRAVATAHVVQSDGKIVLAGQDEGAMNIALARFQTIASVITHTIAAASGPNGSISCIPTPVNHAGNSTCTISPSAGYAVDTFTVDGTPATLTNNQYDFSNVMANHTANVTFRSAIAQGDVNNDGVVDLADAILALQLISQIPLPSSVSLPILADINGEGRIGLQEAIYILQKVAKIR